MKYLLLILAAGCSASSPAIDLTFSANTPASLYRLELFEPSRAQLELDTGFVPVRGDLTQVKDGIKLRLSRGGAFTLLLIGVNGQVNGDQLAPGSTALFWAGHVNVSGSTPVSAQLLGVQAGDDADGDWWPDSAAFLQHTSGAGALYGHQLELLDCYDGIGHPLDSGGSPIKASGAQINPFAAEICGDGFDENCSGNGDEACLDADGDGDPAPGDCDDRDPSRHHATSMDPFPDPPNCCGYTLGKQGTSDELKDLTGDPVLCPKPRCGDGTDQGCQGHDTPCLIDADCDGYPAPPQGNDCDDHDPAVHPGALEPCGSVEDLDCDGVVNGGCLPCDLDGDGFERSDPANGCPDSKDKNPGKPDCNDDDAAVFPGATTVCGGSEAGTTSIGRLSCSLRQYCRTVYEPTGAGGTAKVSAYGWLIGDADCNGTAWQDCPPASCDHDGDGWPVNDGTCAAVAGKFDCDDTNPNVYPGAPVSCGSGPGEDCTSTRQPCTNDNDSDGWNAGIDCNDNDPNVHPWALELCDGKDNDCDGLVDEGNPDAQGNPLVANGAVLTCTDSNVGECAKQKGQCVCSIALPMGTLNSANRIACPSELSGAAKPPHCFGAGQPHPQSCDSDHPRDDDCDGRNDDPAGVNLAVKGMPCGIDGPGPLSACKQGLVIGCDSSQTNCFARYGRIPPSQSWYVCSAEAVCPGDEQCNGLDDDCDGLPAGNPSSAPMLSQIPAGDEFDHDGDGYLACSGCAGLTLASGIQGCDDCNDVDHTVHVLQGSICSP